MSRKYYPGYNYLSLEYPSEGTLKGSQLHVVNFLLLLVENINTFPSRVTHRPLSVHVLKLTVNQCVAPLVTTTTHDQSGHI